MSQHTTVWIDTACSLGMCAERNAIANMITNGENAICRVIAVDWSEKAILLVVPAENLRHS